MTRRWIDGMVVTVDESHAPLVGVDIEDVVYDDAESAGTVDVFTAEEYEHAAEEYNSAQKLLTLLQCSGFKELVSILQKNADYHALVERRYTALDLNKMQGLRMNRISADYSLKFVSDMVENAKQTPRPVLKA